jgi:hypothetical protein
MEAHGTSKEGQHILESFVLSGQQAVWCGQRLLGTTGELMSKG